MSNLMVIFSLNTMLLSTTDTCYLVYSKAWFDLEVHSNTETKFMTFRLLFGVAKSICIAVPSRCKKLDNTSSSQNSLYKLFTYKSYAQSHEHSESDPTKVAKDYNNRNMEEKIASVMPNSQTGLENTTRLYGLSITSDSNYSIKKCLKIHHQMGTILDCNHLTA